MYSSSFTLKRLRLVPILVVLAVNLLLVRSVLSLNMTNAYLQHKCYFNQGKYKKGSGFEKDLTDTLQSLARTGDFNLGFQMGSSNDSYAIVQCRGDTKGDKCRSCFITAIAGLRRRCPRNKGGIIWYDQCFLEFNSIDTRFQIDYENNVYMTNAKEVPDPETSFNLGWVSLLDNLTTIATEKDDNDPTLLYAAGERRIGRMKLYGMVQCAPDVSKKGCPECYAHNLQKFYKHCKDKQGARVLGRSCSFRFELYPFVNSKNELKDLAT